ncbi:MAG TPA: TetR/AcrR family transcriptional regulator [Polyangiales bacterium]|nr:TetR/AcrR family transcriptional regulator [Polyangiales bacterium]
MSKLATRSLKRKVPRLGRPPGQLGGDTRASILLAARGCFASVGFERATNQEIAAAAGITAGALYRHFESKPDLYLAVVRAATAEIMPRVQSALAGAHSLKAAFRALLELVAGLNQSERSATQFLAGLPSEMKRHPEIARLVLADPGEMFTLFNQMVSRGVRAGEIPKEHAQRAVSTIIATMMGASAYTNLLGPELGAEAIAGFIDLLENKLFLSPRV